MAIDDRIIEVDGNLWRITIDGTMIGISNKPEVEQTRKHQLATGKGTIPAPVNVVLPAALILDIWDLL